MAEYIDFRHVKAAADFTAVLAHYGIELKGAGEERRALCPFHDDDEPSLSINVDKRVYHCFGCDERGNVLEFVAAMEETDNLREAARKLAEICQTTLAPERERSGARKSGGSRRRGGRKQEEKKEPPAREREAATENKPLTFKLKLNPEHPYGAERGLSPEIIDAFGMGYCSRGMMAGRWCVPIHNEQGELVAYAGRWVDDELPEDTARYLLPPEFNKSRVLFNLDALDRPELVVVVEGYFGAVRLHELGVPVVSVMGNSISKEQVELLKRAGVERVALMFDGDDAGRTAAERVVPPLARQFFVRDAVLPEGTQPDTVGEEWVRQWIEVLGL